MCPYPSSCLRADWRVDRSTGREASLYTGSKICLRVPSQTPWGWQIWCSLCSQTPSPQGLSCSGMLPLPLYTGRLVILWKVERIFFFSFYAKLDADSWRYSCKKKKKITTAFVTYSLPLSLSLSLSLTLSFSLSLSLSLFLSLIHIIPSFLYYYFIPLFPQRFFFYLSPMLS